MKYLTLSLIRILVFWMLFFFVLRMVFVVYHLSFIRLENIPTGEVVMAFVKSLKLDLSTASYIGLLSFVLLCVFLVVKQRWLLGLNKLVQWVIIGLTALVVSSELGLYSEWKSKLSAKALAYLAHPQEVWQTVSFAQFTMLIVVWMLLSATGWYMYRLIVDRYTDQKTPSSASSLLASLWLVPALFLGARGGLSAIPVSVSSAYYSKFSLMNAASVNSLYNIGFSLLNASRIDKTNIFASLDDQKARQMVAGLHKIQESTTPVLLQTNRPNIVVLLLESWSADLIESLGGEPGITPFFKELEKEGLLFTAFYANANRSQQAIGSLYGGLPGIPLTTISDHPDKYNALPSLSKTLRQVGYQSAFYFGGQLNYGNILSYLISNELDVIVEGKDLPESLPRGRLGVHDGFMLPWAAEQMSALKQPFFATLFTLSSHAPYDFPMEQVITWPEIEKPFVNGGHYTDKALAAFFDHARQKDWYANTLFVLMADHSKNSYRNHPLESFEYHKIPLLLYGPVLKPDYRGQQIHVISGNTDVPATLLKQLDMPATAFPWSKNVLASSYQPFAYFELNEGMGWKTPEGEFVWNKFTDLYYKNTFDPVNQADEIIKGKAYLQVLYGDFLSY